MLKRHAIVRRSRLHLERLEERLPPGDLLLGPGSMLAAIRSPDTPTPQPLPVENPSQVAPTLRIVPSPFDVALSVDAREERITTDSALFVLWAPSAEEAFPSAAASPVRGALRAEEPTDVPQFSGSIAPPPLSAGGTRGSPTLLVMPHAEGVQLADAVNAAPLPQGGIDSLGTPTVKLFAVDSHASKLGLEPAVFIVTRDSTDGADLRVQYSVSGTAVSGVDFQALPGFVDIPAEAFSATITVQPLPPPGGVETQRTVRVTLTEDAAYTLGPPSTTSVLAYIHPAPPAGGTALLPANPLPSFSLQGGGAGQADMSIVPVADMPFTQALRVRTYVRPQNPWSFQLHARNIAPVTQGHVALATFYLRAVNPDTEVVTDLIVERNGSPYTKSADFRTSAGARWERIDVPFTFAEGYAVNGASINFRVGFDPQQLEIGGIQVVNYANAVTPANLPAAPITYLSREPDAAWRADAAQRIDQYRKADLAVVVQDSLGNPVPDASVSMQMWRHAFGLGSAVPAARIMEQSADGDIFRAVVSSFFNRVTLENDLKWPFWENPGWRPRTLQALNWLESYGIQVRGHTLLWQSWEHMPNDVQGLAGNPPALRNRINNHLADEAGTLAGRLVDWDVVNEPYCCNVLTNILGMQEMVEWFNRTRQADPYSRLYINDYGILSGRGLEVSHQNAYYDTIQFLQSRGAALDGIGLQSHFGAGLTRPEKLLEILNRFAATGLQLQSTEFDVAIREEQVQADYLRDFMTLLFSHPSVDGIVMWGFWEASHWRPEAALFRRDWSVKPNGQQWYDLVFADWWTNVAGTTNAQGVSGTRGFQGEYVIEVNHQGVQQFVYATLPAGGTTVVVTV